jgi:hypothetical protein
VSEFREHLTTAPPEWIQEDQRRGARNGLVPLKQRSTEVLRRRPFPESTLRCRAAAKKFF